MRKKWITLVVMVLAALGCSGVQVSQDYDPATDFGSMNRYRWKSDTQEKTGDPRIDNPLQDTRIRAAVERLLAEKGVIESAADTPTFLIRYQYLLRRKIESGGTSGSVGFGVGSYGRRGGVAIGTGNEVREYDEGALVIDFLDAGSDALLWRGTGSHRYREFNDPEKATGAVNTLVEKVLSQFPPGQTR